MFQPSTYENFITAPSEVQRRLFPQYRGGRADFDIIVVGSGMGGGVLADDLADRLGASRRILVVEAGSYLFPTHVFNLCRFPNSAVAGHFACGTFWQSGNPGSERYIHERPQLNFGGRSIFWSGLIPTIQPWELAFFPPAVRNDLRAGLLERAGLAMNASVTLGPVAQAVVQRLRATPLADHFDIQETARALHQPYLVPDDRPHYHMEPTGVFNTAELLINQAGLAGSDNGDGPGLHLLLDHYVEDVRPADGGYELVVRHTPDGSARFLTAPTVVLAGGSIESPKLLRRSSLFPRLPSDVQPLVGRGLTDHPTTDWITTFVDAIGDVALPPDSHAKIVFYSRGQRDDQGRVVYPFNVEMNLNHEYWHLRENDPSNPAVPIRDDGASRLEIKFSFANSWDPGNAIMPAPPFGYVPEIAFRNLNWTDHLTGSRLPAVAGWERSAEEVFAVLNGVTHQIFSAFSWGGVPARPDDEVWYGQRGKDFGLGTVHHAIGTLRMPRHDRHGEPVGDGAVVDEHLEVVGAPGLHVCDMSVLPFSSAANPVRTLVALALRLSARLG